MEELLDELEEYAEILGALGGESSGDEYAQGAADAEARIAEHLSDLVKNYRELLQPSVKQVS